MVEYAEEIKRLEDELRNTQYNKATEHHFGVVKAKIAKLREKIEKRAASKKGGTGWSVKKSGDATVVILGFPSVGKSTLLNALTGTSSKVAAYEFTTLDVIPGLLRYNNAKIQLLDIPGIVQGASSGKGRGKEVLSIVRSSDLVLILIDALHPEHRAAILKETQDARIRLNQQQPEVRIAKKIRGGLSVASRVKLKNVSIETLTAVLREMGIINADVVIGTDVTLDEFIDAVEGNRTYIPAITTIAKIDLVDESTREKLQKELKPDAVVSAEKGEGLEELKEIIFQRLNLIRIFLKEASKKPDLDEPMVVRNGARIRTICDRIHRDFARRFRYARVWGKSAKFPGQQFRNLDKTLADGDIVEIHVA